jgi:WD40 repeat protein
MRLWDAATGVPVRTFDVGGTLTTGVFSPDGRRVAGAGEAGQVVVFDGATGARVQTLDHGVFVNSLVFAGGGAQVASVGGDGSLVRFNLATGTAQREAAALCAIAFFVDASPDGATLATVGLDTALRLWDAATGRLVRTIHGNV